MKRTDMLKLIENYLDIICPDKFIYNDDRAEDILKIIEKAGMLPPINKEKSFIMLPDGEMIYNVNEWDEE